jgi:hypothetical protein
MPKAGNESQYTMMLRYERVDGGGKARLTHDQDGHEHLCPVCLVRGLEGRDNFADEESQHGDHDGKGDGRVREHKARHSGRKQTADHGRHEFGGDEERRLAADFQQEAPAEVDPDSKGSPSDADERHRVDDWLGQDGDWD